jgi:CheY-like chemotaxis protein
LVDRLIEISIEASRARRFTPALALVDLRLPDMSSWDVVRALRGDPAFGVPRVWAMTGLDDPEAHRRSAEAGCEHHFLKPVDASSLERLLGALR